MTAETCEIQEILMGPDQWMTLKDAARTVMTEGVEYYFDAETDEVDSWNLAQDCATALAMQTNKHGDLPMWLHDLAIDIAIAHEETR